MLLEFSQIYILWGLKITLNDDVYAIFIFLTSLYVKIGMVLDRMPNFCYLKYTPLTEPPKTFGKGFLNFLKTFSGILGVFLFSWLR